MRGRRTRSGGRTSTRTRSPSPSWTGLAEAGTSQARPAQPPPTRRMGVAIDTAAGQGVLVERGRPEDLVRELDDTGGGGDLDTTGASVVDARGSSSIAPDALLGAHWGTSPGFTTPISITAGAASCSTGAPGGNPSGVAVDQADNRIYWANFDLSVAGQQDLLCRSGRHGAAETWTPRERCDCPFARGGRSTRPRAGSTGSTRAPARSVRRSPGRSERRATAGRSASTGRLIDCQPAGGHRPGSRRRHSLYWSGRSRRRSPSPISTGPGARETVDGCGATSRSNVDYPAILRGTSCRRRAGDRRSVRRPDQL